MIMYQWSMGPVKLEWLWRRPLSTGHAEQHTGNDTKCEEKQNGTLSLVWLLCGRYGIYCMKGGRAREISGMAIKMFMCNRNDNVCFFHWNDHSNFRRWLLHKYTQYIWCANTHRQYKYKHTYIKTAMRIFSSWPREWNGRASEKPKSHTLYLRLLKQYTYPIFVFWIGYVYLSAWLPPLLLYAKANVHKWLKLNERLNQRKGKGSLHSLKWNIAPKTWHNFGFIVSIERLEAKLLFIKIVYECGTDV